MPVNMHAILVGLFSVAHTPEQADHAARSVLDQHAHELAKQQHAYAEAENGEPGCWHDGAHAAARLIDPEAQQ